MKSKAILNTSDQGKSRFARKQLALCNHVENCFEERISMSMNSS